MTVAIPPLRAELIAIGTELLLGEIVDTNSAFIARALRGIGLDLLYISQIGDNEERIAEVIARGLERSGIVITTGGLGPTVDDVSREAVARATQRPLELVPDLVAQIEARFAKWGRRMTENNRRQAMIPNGAIPISNPVGTAPSFIVETESGAVISVPGVPKEMEYLLEREIIPYLRRRFELTGVIKARVLRTAGLGESMIDEKIGEYEKLPNPTVGLAAHPAAVDVRITAKAASEEEADRMIAEVEAPLRERLGEAIFGADGETVEGVLLRLLTERAQTLASAEAGTDGTIAARLSAAADRTTAFLAGVVAPTPEALAAQLSLDGAGMGLGTLAEQVAGRAAEAHHADLGLACLIRRVKDGVQIGIGLARGEARKGDELGFGGHFLLLPQWAATIAIDRMRRWIISGKMLA
ncbi:MAG: CinA family nicotinamide mononucleotide deamidase-related protein [Chloroflexi bacterium]|nr:CinA family nicotinamide mononucleotide deamidase-related protein [Chloroflexota bacterium]